jgi:hypothetical protein
MLSNRARARANELEVLSAIGEMGWLSTAQIAAWVWKASTLHVATNKASLVLARLTEEGLLLRRESAVGIGVFVLTMKGALRANSVHGPAYRAGYKLSQLDCYRQKLIVNFLISMRLQGHVCVGPAGLRRAMALGLILEGDWQGADALIQNCLDSVFEPVLVVRSLNLNVVEKAIRLKAGSGRLHLVGNSMTVRLFERAMLHSKGKRVQFVP